MGNFFPTLKVSSVLRGGGLKRNVEEVYPDEEDEADSVLNASKKMKSMSTSKYIYKTLFEEGKDSDVSVFALGHQWKLHKVYLCQSPYFCSMFSGNWKETNESDIHIEILDDSITIESMSIVLGSFYKDETAIESVHIIPVLATAVLLQMDSLIELCSSVMKETISIKTVLDYYDASRRYGVVEIEKACREWLLHNLLTLVTESSSVLKMIHPSLMKELIMSPDLYVMQTEFSIYVMLKAWTFLILNSYWQGCNEELFVECHKFFQQRKSKNCFLETEEGSQFVSVFSSLRFSHLINHHLDVELISSDRILPGAWLQPAATLQWYNMLRIELDKDKGPSNVSDEEFNRLCSRCGRLLDHNAPYIWRWTGYNFGLDLVMTYENFCIKLKRNHRTESLLNITHQSRRQIMCRVNVASLDENKQVIYTKTTGIKSLQLSRNEEIRLMDLDSAIKFPLALSACFLVNSPNELKIAQSGSQSDSLENVAMA